MANLWFVPVVAFIFYFLMIRPQRRKEKDRRVMLDTIKKHDRVITIGGICGVVKRVTDDQATILVDDKRDTQLTMSRWGIRTIVLPEDKGELSRDRD